MPQQRHEYQKQTGQAVLGSQRTASSPRGIVTSAVSGASSCRWQATGQRRRQLLCWLRKGTAGTLKARHRQHSACRPGRHVSAAHKPSSCATADKICSSTFNTAAVRRHCHPKAPTGPSKVPSPGVHRAVSIILVCISRRHGAGLAPHVNPQATDQPQARQGPPHWAPNTCDFILSLHESPKAHSAASAVLSTQPGTLTLLWGSRHDAILHGGQDAHCAHRIH
jgi:hypothetical protein